MPRAEDHDDNDPHEVERQRVAYLRRHREQLQQRYRLEAERRVEELETDVTAMRARRDDVRAAKNMEEDKAVAGRKMSKVKLGTEQTRSLPGIYARFDDLGEEELQLLAKRFDAGNSQAPLNMRGKYHARYVKDEYPIAGSQLKLEKEREMGVAARKKLLLTDAAVKGRNLYAHRKKDGGVLSNGLERSHGRSNLEHYIGKLTTSLKSRTGASATDRVRKANSTGSSETSSWVGAILEADAQRSETVRLSSLYFTGEKEANEKLTEVIAWLKFHSFVDVNIPVRLAPEDDMEHVAVCEDKTLGVTPLMAACRSLCAGLVNSLLEHGAVVWLTTANGDTAMHFLWRDWTQGPTESLKDVAALALLTQRTHDILVTLIAEGADVNAQNAFGETALHFCARFGLQDSAKLLLRNGADAFLRDRKGISAVQFAHDHHYEGLHQLLLHYDMVERTRAREKERHDTSALLNQKRGVFAATWSQTPEDFFAKLQVEHQRAGHLRNQYVDNKGQVLVCQDEDE